MKDIDVVYNKETNVVVAVRENDMWVLPVELEVKQFRKGAEPVFAMNDKKQILLNNNVMILNERGG